MPPLPHCSIVTRRGALRACIGTSAWLAAVPDPLCAADTPTVNPPALTPDRVTPLFNGRDLTGLYSWLADSAHADPKRVWSVRDGVLRCSGEVHGYLATRQAWRDYRLVVEYQWGALTYGAKGVRNSGVLLHATGPDGNRSPWMSSIECQVAQGCVGDFIAIRGKDEQGATIPVTISADTELGPDKRLRWKPGGAKTVYANRQFWWSRHEAGFQELIDTPGKHDVDSPLGEWTRLECVSAGNRITVIVNGTTVNECYDVWPAAGKILLESEGFEILFRKFELHPLPKATK